MSGDGSSPYIIKIVRFDGTGNEGVLISTSTYTGGVWLDMFIDVPGPGTFTYQFIVQDTNGSPGGVGTASFTGLVMKK